MLSMSGKEPEIEEAYADFLSLFDTLNPKTGKIKIEFAKRKYIFIRLRKGGYCG